MCNGNRNWYRYTFVFDKVMELEKFYYMYKDLMYGNNKELIEIWKKNNHNQWNFWYNGYTLVMYLTKEDKERIVKDLKLKKHEKTRRGNSTYKVA